VLRRLAWVNVAVHLAGLGFAVIAMRPGSPLVELAQRRAYLAALPFGWSLGWGAWMLCTLALIAFFAALAHRLRDAGPWPTLAVTLVAAGGAVDLLCDTIHLTVTPRLAARPPEELFLAFEGTAVAGGLIVANGLYTVATLLLTLCLARSQGLSPAVVPVGCGVVVGGSVMVAAGFLDSPRLTELSTGPTIGLFCVWTVLVARSLELRRAEP
jgi:hypothetical protein